MTYNATRLKENGMPYAKESKLAKHFTSQVHLSHHVLLLTFFNSLQSECLVSVSTCLEVSHFSDCESVEVICKGVGFTKEFPAEKYFRDCKFGQIVEGTANVSIL